MPCFATIMKTHAVVTGICLIIITALLGIKGGTGLLTGSALYAFAFRILVGVLETGPRGNVRLRYVLLVSLKFGLGAGIIYLGFVHGIFHPLGVIAGVTCGVITTAAIAIRAIKNEKRCGESEAT